jgi:hypothetical protein
VLEKTILLKTDLLTLLRFNIEFLIRGYLYFLLAIWRGEYIMGIVKVSFKSSLGIEIGV